MRNMSVLIFTNLLFKLSEYKEVLCVPALIQIPQAGTYLAQH